jgi:FAD-linked sulfhydryl oxidase
MALGPAETTEKQDEEQAVPKKLPKGVVLGPDGKP